jgi:glutamine synthetase
MYEEGRTLKRVRRLPHNLLDAIRLTEKSKVLRAGLGAEFVDSFCRLKHAEWMRYMNALSQWEIDNTFDC